MGKTQDHRKHFSIDAFCIEFASLFNKMKLNVEPHHQVIRITSPVLQFQISCLFVLIMRLSSFCIPTTSVPFQNLEGSPAQNL